LQRRLQIIQQRLHPDFLGSALAKTIPEIKPTANTGIVMPTSALAITPFIIICYLPEIKRSLQAADDMATLSTNYHKLIVSI
jgi:hypothetical protein